jgi:REP element-mobilizing transposase RayT
MAIVENPDKFADKFKLKSPRLQNWNYSSSGIYFITICTHNHNNFFGKIIDEKMELSKIGIITKSELLKTFEIRKNIKLHEWVIMPNHVHILMGIKNQIINNNVETSRRGVSTKIKNISINNLKPNIHKPEIAIKNWHPNSISSIICQFKSVCTKIIKKENLWFAWQPRFHDHIIKNQKEYLIIKKYIRNNITSWNKDKFYKSM